MKSSEDSEMAIHVEHVGVLERAREVSRLEDIITEDNEDIEDIYNEPDCCCSKTNQ